MDAEEGILNAQATLPNGKECSPLARLLRIIQASRDSDAHAFRKTKNADGLNELILNPTKTL